MSDLLGQMGRTSQARLEAARATEPLEALRGRALATAAPPALVLDRFDLIAECKLRAPSSGPLAGGPVDLPARAGAYARGGAAAISVLTEPHRFDGRPEHLVAVSTALSCPAMRKDFVVGPYQVWEARAWGAGGVLLIARMLDDTVLEACLDTAAEAGLFVLLECFDADDCARATAHLAGRTAVLTGVNTRDLRTLEVVAARLERLVDRLPGDAPRVAESGMEGPEDCARAAAMGYDLALVGTALMRQAAPETLVREMVAAGRAACS